MNRDAWTQIDAGLSDLMAGNDQEPVAELKAKSNRLKHLSSFVETLRLRINERIKGENVGDLVSLFSAYYIARNQVDANTK